MKDRFSGERGIELLVEALQNQRVFTGVPQAAQATSTLGELVEVPKGAVLIEQNATDNEIYFVISGSLGVFVNSKRVGTRHAGDTAGEMAAVSVTQRRSADVIADENCLVFKVSEAGFCQVADKTPVVWRRVAQELSKRLIQRNALIRPPHEKIRVFVISSAESLHIARAVENAFAHDPFLTVVWANGVFRVTNYTLETLEDELEQSDFAVAIAHPDDQAVIRGENWPSPRDNVVFELGFFMGKLGRERAILMEPRGQKVKLPSDLAGITTIGYRHEPGGNLASLMSPACNELRDHILRLGRNI